MVRALSVQDFEFSNVVVECESAAGVRFPRLVRTGMPKITPNAIKCVFYLYCSERDAELGSDPQGTGFLVGESGKAPAPFGWRTHLYAVTNWHIVHDDSDKDSPPAPVIRLNRRDGEPHVVPLERKDWRFIPDLDVAVAPLELDFEKVDALCVPIGMMLGRAEADKFEIGVGDDVFMMGLFVDHHGGPTNVPAARFGNISMMPNPNALLEQGGLPDVEGYVLDMHSRDGFSGSPVFVYRTFGSDLTVPISSHFDVELGWGRTSRGVRDVGTVRSLSDVRLNVKHETIFELLGIHYAQFPEEFESEKAGAISGLSGMTCAIPSWSIIDVLNLPELVEMREKKDAEILRRAKKRPKLEKTNKAAANDEPPEGDREAFKRLLRAGVKSPRSSG